MNRALKANLMMVAVIQFSRSKSRLLKTIVKAGLSMIAVAVCATLLPGCMYSAGKQQYSPVSYRESVMRIQQAIEAFQADQGILPIITAGSEVAKYEKYRIDLYQLKQQGYIDEIPSTAFEKGGSAYFLVINEEVAPTVRVMDLVTVQKVNDVQRLVNQFMRSNPGQLPVKQELYSELYELDLSKIGGDHYSMISVFSGVELPFLLDQAGVVYVDYAWDIMRVIDNSDASILEGVIDLREILIDQSYFVPVKSLPYEFIDHTPIPQAP